MAVAAVRGVWLAAGLVALLAGCNPIETYRSARGLDANDPGPNAPFAKNLAAGESESYPNLSTVPAPPTRASTVAERAELTKKLIAERTSTETEAAPLQAPAAPAGAAAAAPATLPTVKVASAAPAANPAAPPIPATAATPTGSAADAGTSPEPAASAPTPTSPSGRRAGRQPREAPPQESTLQMPEIASVPAPEAGQPAPPPPHLAPAPTIPAVDLPKTAAAVEMPVPAPAVPVLGPPPAPPTPAPKQAMPRPGPILAALDLSDPPRLDAVQRASLDKVAAVYRDKPGTVKIVAYAAPASDSPDRLASYNAALDRAQFVAAALAQAGVPSNKIQSEAAPADAGAGAGRIEVRLAP